MRFAPPGRAKPYRFAARHASLDRIMSSYNNIENDLNYVNKVDLPTASQGDLVQIDEKTGNFDEQATASFLFITKEGISGGLQIQPHVV